MPLAQTNAVTATDGTLLDLDSLPHTFGWTGSDLTTDTVTFVDKGVTLTYMQTMTYSGGVIQASSEWVKQ